jgi:hypothetical protein
MRQGCEQVVERSTVGFQVMPVQALQPWNVCQATAPSARARRCGVAGRRDDANDRCRTLSPRGWTVYVLCQHRSIAHGSHSVIARSAAGKEVLVVSGAPGETALTPEDVACGLQIAAGYEHAVAGDPVSDDPAYVRFVNAWGLCLRRDPYGAGLRCTRHRGHGGTRCVADGTQQVQAVWSAQEPFPEIQSDLTGP